MNATILSFLPPIDEDERPEGFAFLPPTGPYGGRGYRCNPLHHCIDVVDIVDGHEQPLFSFGGYGPLRGQFNTPADVVMVSLDPHAPMSPDSAILAVADRGNNRVQFFDLDGAAFNAAGARTPRRARQAWPSRSGWPFFRIATTPRIAAPSRLEWRAPFLNVTAEGGAIVSLSMPAAILPEFSDWLRMANPVELRHAMNHFLHDPYRDEVPGSCLQRIAERLKPAAAASIETLYGRTA